MMPKLLFMSLTIICIPTALNAAASGAHAVATAETSPTHKQEHIFFEDCVTQDTTRIAGKNNLHWAPVIFWAKMTLKNQVPHAAAKKHLAPDGTYSCYDIRSYVGFVGAADKAVAEDIARTLMSSDCTLWRREYFYGTSNIHQLLDKVIDMTVFWDARVRKTRQSIAITEGSFHLEDETIIAPTELHAAYKEQDLDPANAKHRALMACFAEHAAESSFLVPYFVINQEILHKFLVQEDVGARL
jgi:hypothetical protein